ncbi:MAG: hypothetical protein IJI12_02565 [Atopobiaceae bacterium]|nr:hypothetical protein [Atopobiaceae bacterium]
MKAIFLDIDGVIATPTSVRLNYLLGRGPDRQRFDTVSLTYLRRLVAATGAIVVLTSTWREDMQTGDPYVNAIMDNLFAQLEDAGAPVSSLTPIIQTADRSAEIGAWLDEHPCEAYVIFDDLARFADRPEVVEGHLVLIADSEGIRHHHFQQALQILEH